MKWLKNKVKNIINEEFGRQCLDKNIEISKCLQHMENKIACLEGKVHLLEQEAKKLIPLIPKHSKKTGNKK